MREYCVSVACQGHKAQFCAWLLQPVQDQHDLCAGGMYKTDRDLRVCLGRWTVLVRFMASDTDILWIR